MKRVVVLAVVAGVAFVAIACRQGEPSSDPKTPANSPLPKLPTKDPEPGGSAFDAG